MISTPITGQRLIKDCQVLDLPWYGREYLLEGAEHQIRDPMLLGNVSLSGAEQIVHVNLDVLQTVGGRRWGGRSVVGIICGLVNG